MEFETLQNIIAHVLNVATDEVTMDSTFAEDLGADSLDLYQVVIEVEEMFQIEIPEERIKNVATVGEAVKLLSSCLRKDTDSETVL